MKGLIMVSLIPLMVLSLFSIMFGNQFVRIDIEAVSVRKGADKYATGASYFDIDPVTASLALIIVIALAGALIGIRFLGSGLSEISVRLINVGLCYTAIWSFLSLLAYPLIREIDIFGGVIYLFLTVLYTFGVIDKMVGE